MNNLLTLRGVNAHRPRTIPSHGYDSTGADSGGWSRTFHYDPYGNMWVDPSYTGPPLNVYTPTANNYNANNQRSDQTYDAAGNLTAAQPSLALSYDAENRLATAGTTSYAYDGNGQRVLKISGSATTVYVYDALGGLAAEYSNVGNTSPCTTCYLSYDYLGSTRLVTDQNGAVVARHDYLPFGEEVPANGAGRDGTWGSGGDTVSEKFTGKERDSESGLDYFGARYYGSALGRFSSPDDGSDQDTSDPQSWNLYSYVRNGPLTSTDPTGREEKHCDSDGNNCKFETTVTDTAVQILFAPMIAMSRTAEQAQQALQHVADWASQPRSPVCTAGYTGIGATIGFWAGGGLGSLGLAGGPAAVATIPGGATGGSALGGAIGGVGGLVLCTTGSGSGGNGGGESYGSAQDKSSAQVKFGS